jgi:hypothetical protein
MKNNMIIKMTIILFLISYSICLAKEKEYNNELEFGDPSSKKVLQIGGNGDLNITGYKGNKVIISTDENIFEESDDINEKARGLKKIRMGGFNIINDKKENTILIVRPVHKNVDLNIMVPNGITLKLGNGFGLKNENLKTLNKKAIEQNEYELKEDDTVDVDVDIGKSLQTEQKMQKNIYIKVPKIHVTSKFSQSNGIIDGDISIKDFTGVVEVNTVNGDIIAENISGEAVASTVEGDLKISFITLNKDRDQYLSTVNGDVDITLPTEVKADILARTMDGDVYTGFDVDLTYGNQLEDRKGDVPQYPYNPYYNSNIITAHINGGGNKVYLNTINGNIYIRKGK